MANESKTVLTGQARKLPMMPIRDMVIFPSMMTLFVVGRVSSVRALEEAFRSDRKIFLATQHDASVDEPSVDDIYETGTIGNIVQSVRMPDGNIKVLVEGVERARSIEVNDDDGFFVATVRTGKTARDDPAGGADDAARSHALRAVCEAAAVAERRDDGGGRAHGRAGQAGGHDCGQPAAFDRREAAAAGCLRPGDAAGARGRCAGRGHREAEHGPHHPVARQAADGEGAEQTTRTRRTRPSRRSWAAARSRSSTN